MEVGAGERQGPYDPPGRRQRRRPPSSEPLGTTRRPRPGSGPRPAALGPPHSRALGLCPLRGAGDHGRGPQATPAIRPPAGLGKGGARAPEAPERGGRAGIEGSRPRAGEGLGEAWDSEPGRGRGGRPAGAEGEGAGPRPQGQGCAGPPGAGPTPDRDAEVESPPLLTSEHRLGPRDHGHHHGLVLVLRFLAFERHLEAVQRGAFGLEGHGAAGAAAPGLRRAGARARRSAAAPSPPPAGPATAASGPPRDLERRDPGRGGLNPGPQPPAAPFYGASLSAPCGPPGAGPPPSPARPITRGAAPRTRPR